MWIRKKEIEEFSDIVKGFSNNEDIDIRKNKEGVLNILRNDLNSFVVQKNSQIKKLEDERNSLAEYMADISHQLKTPITSMMIMADLLEDADSDKRLELLHNIKFSLKKMDWLVGTLLKMAKIDAHVINFNKKEILVSNMIKELMPSIEILLDINNQSIEIKNETLMVCDKKWTIEALTNIIKNAIEHSPNDGRIVIDSGENPIYYWISINDSGIGMNRTSYQALFKRFEYSTNENGFGIGMPLAMSIVKGQGGDIDVDFGGNGKGATFTIKFYKND